MLSRQNGFYRVLYREEGENSRWVVAEYQYARWFIQGAFMAFHDEELLRIDENRIPMPDDIVNDKTDKE